MPPTKVSECPPPATLQQLSSGALAETEAEAVFSHVDDCEFCQEHLDRIAMKQQNVVAKAQRLAKGKDSGNQLSRLIRNAQTLTKTETVAERPAKAITLDSFVSGLRRCGLFDDSQVDALVSNVKSVDSSSMARELVSRQKLTPFQARALLKGRWKGIVLGNYEILEKLGQGGMGSVFRARHRRLGRIVCVKVMNQAGRKSEAMLERFRNEARTIAALSHPNFIVAHDADEAEGVPFLAMEFVEGDDLAKHVTSHGPLKVPEALEAVRQAAEAMQYAHDQRVVHRDIKPHNIMLTTDSDSGDHSVKILDLGLARFDSVLNDDDVDAGLRAAMTNTGVIMGTVDYMSPEQAIRSRDADHRSDIYSLGCTLHYLLTGVPVFEGDTVMARLVAHREQVIPSLEDKCFAAMPCLDAVFYKMVAKDPTLRYQSMSEVADEVTALLAGQLPKAAQADSLQNESVLKRVSGRRRRTSYFPWGLLGVLLCAACIVGWAANSGLFAVSPGKAVAESFEASEPVATKEASRLFDVSASPAFSFENAGTLSQGGDGVALIILPFKDPNLQHLVAWEEALKDKNIDVAYASTQTGQTQADTDYNLPYSLKLSDPSVSIENVDMILFVGGPQQDFKQPSTRELLQSFVESAMPQGVVLGNFADTGYQALEPTRELCGDTAKSGGISRRSHFAQSGVYFEIKPHKKPAENLQAATELISLAIQHRKQHAVKRDSLNQPSFYDKLPKQVRKFWGDGRALVVIPDGFNRDEWLSLNKVLKEDHGVEFLVTSSKWGTIVNSDGKSPLPVDIMMDQFVAEQFDYVVFMDGDMESFDEEDTRNDLEVIVKESIDAGLVLIAMSKQAARFYDLSNIGGCLDKAGHGLYRKAEFGNGIVTAVDKPWDLFKLFNKENLPALRDAKIGRP